MNSVKPVSLERLLASLATIASSVGCTTGVAIPVAPPPATGTAEAQATPPPAAGAALRQAHASGPQACTIEGAPRIVATTAAPHDGVEADADASQVWLRFAKKANARVVMAIDPESLDVVEASDSPPSKLEDANFVALHVFPVQSAWSCAVGSGRTRQQAPVDSRRSVLAWTEGSVYAGLDVRVSTIGSDGEPLGAPVTLAHEGSAIGQPAVAVASSGRGLVAFIESNGHGFQLVAASLDCTSPVSANARPTWARK
jgi:hypothetical protein